ncbi:3-deoxy-8-phosphooctulonate synthase [Caldithrix abyssi]|uniref:3-deoxy-8-phosphooctulonate synthase n=1 Tax=Caldithrix abyssi DSM 13497 TaxID=880073 RepID=H1XTV3_CALAY|nr:3-deoxy-8-phosphooctulonate synthase [Caldithrix abyssi]APF18741.1 2-dehydro-3-deoxyphosphooctonate aldolase (KDO 8-P synthase) [Caldithrix abyssi DSM 13497]EHO42720.1 2-dehydro-3-deoxyphosphooctonate aldolase [Caldithrix abyssi DSM 13497]
MKIIDVAGIKIGPGHPLALIAGPCVIESEDIVLKTAEQVKAIADRLDMPLIFKSSYLKDNRSSAESYQGPGLEKGLKILQKVKDTFGIPVLSDIHDAHDAEACAEVLDVIQVPAFLSMQTTLLLAVARTGKVINVKKGQFLAASDMQTAINKITGQGNDRILLTERGTFFGYHNLIVDMRNLKIMRDLGYPVVLDPTHAIRKYGVSSSDPRGGAKEFIFGLTRAGVAAGVDALFIETHPDCDGALCDAASMLPLQKLEELLKQAKAIDELIKPHLPFDETGLYDYKNYSGK